MVPHKGGKRMEEDDWAYRMIYRWVEAGAKPADGKSVFDRLEVTPSEVQFQKDGQTTPLKVVAHWADGTKEDVTCLCRFQTNDESIVSVDENGVITSLGTGDTHVVAFYDNGIVAVPVIRPVSELVGASYPKVETRTEVDRLVVEKLKKLGIEPSPDLRRRRVPATAEPGHDRFAAIARRSDSVPGQRRPRQAFQEDRRTARTADLFRVVGQQAVRHSGQFPAQLSGHARGDRHGQAVVRVGRKASGRRTSLTTS